MREECGLAIVPVSIVEVLDRIVRDESDGVRYHYVLVDYLCRVAESDSPPGFGSGDRGPALKAASDSLEARWAERKDLNLHGPYKLEPRALAVIEKALEMAGKIK